MDTAKSDYIHHIVDKMIELMKEEHRIAYTSSSYISTLYRKSDEVLMYMDKVTDSLLTERAKFRMCGIELKFDFRSDVNGFIIKLTDVINMSNNQFILNLGALNNGNITLDSSPILNQENLITKEDTTVIYDLRCLDMKRQYTTALTFICDKLIWCQINKKPYTYIFDDNTLNNIVQAFKDRYENGKVSSKRKEVLNRCWKSEGIKILRALIQLIIFKDGNLKIDRKIVALDYEIMNYANRLKSIDSSNKGFYGVSNHDIIMNQVFKILESPKVVKNQRDILFREVRKVS
jgi:hypothetical protein